MSPFVDRLVAFIEHDCGQSGFAARMAGYSEPELKAFEERHYRGSIPTEYREFLLRMGKQPSEFKLKDDDMEGFEYVRFWYEDPNEDPEDPLPRDVRIVVAIGQDETYYVLDTTLPGRPVMLVGLEDQPSKVADSFEHLCMERARARYGVR